MIFDYLIKQFAYSLQQLIDIQEGTEFAANSTQCLDRFGAQFSSLFRFTECFFPLLALRYIPQGGREEFSGRASEWPTDRNLNRKLMPIAMPR